MFIKRRVEARTMADTKNVRIVEYRKELAYDLAEMYNTWDELWPGGYTRGIPFDAKRVRKQFDVMSAIAILIAIDEETGKPVGSCTLHRHVRDPEAAYVGTLGVSPEALNKKVGKALLLESVRRVKEAGLTRVDLNTWPGNMRAVPLYKKIGLMWNPEIGGLTMEGFIPGILVHDLCRPFFEKNGPGENDWYNLFTREITQAPDDFEHNAMAVYPYEFVSEEDRLSVTVDRYGRGITAVERTLDGSSLTVSAEIGNHEVLCGIPETYTIRITNGHDAPLKVKIRATGPEGLKFTGESTSTLNLASGEEASWSVPFVLGPDTELFRQGIKAPTIVSDFILNGAQFQLSTGMKVKSAVAIYAKWGQCRMSAGGSARIPLTLVSSLNEDVKAHVAAESSSVFLNTSLSESNISIPAEGLSGAILELSADRNLEEGTHDVWASVEFDVSINGTSVSVKTRKRRIPVFHLGSKGIAVGEDDLRKRKLIATDQYDASCAIEGAIMFCRDTYSPDLLGLSFRSQIGPPFGISPFMFTERELRVEQTDAETTVRMVGDHPERPLLVEDRAVFEHRNGVIRREIWVKNTGSQEHSCQVQIVGPQIGLSFTEGKMHVPMSKGIVSAPMGDSRMCYPVFPSAPDSLGEGWVALEGKTRTLGSFWDQSGIEEARLGFGLPLLLRSETQIIEPGEERMMMRLNLVVGAPSWKDVRRLWSERIRGKYLTAAEPAIHEVAPIHLEGKPIIVAHRERVDATLVLSDMLKVAAQGSIHVSPPPGWTLLSPSMTEIEFSDEAEIALSLEPSEGLPDGFSVAQGEIAFRAGADYVDQFTLLSLGSKGARVSIKEENLEGKRVHRVSNGELEFVVSSEYGGCMTSLKNKNGVEFLITSFPNRQPRPGAFFDNYHGGIQPIAFDDDIGDDLPKAKTNLEKMNIGEVSDGPWKGVEVSWKGTLQKPVRGVDFSLRYMTAPGSPLVLLAWKATNSTKAPVQFYPFLYIDPGLDADLSKLFIQADWSGQERQVRPNLTLTPVTPSTNYIMLRAEEDEKRTTGLAVMTPDDDVTMAAAHVGPIALVGAIDSRVLLLPGESKTMKMCLLLDPRDASEVRSLQKVVEHLL
jgi:ribosomal protein S18 acetylase RimI-like enzyme